MKKSRCGLLVLLLGAGLLAAAEPKELVRQAVEKLRGESNYTWTVQVQVAGARVTPKPTKGLTEKGGYTVVSQEMNQGTAQAVFKGNKVVVKAGDAWQSPAEMRLAASGDGTAPERGAMVGRVLATARKAVDEAEDLLKKTGSLKEDAGIISGDLAEVGVKELLAPRRGQTGDAMAGPTTKDSKGTVKFWLQNGALAKFEVYVEGTLSFRGQERAIKRTRTVEIQNVGSTRVEAPEAARKKLDS